RLDGTAIRGITVDDGACSTARIQAQHALTPQLSDVLLRDDVRQLDRVPIDREGQILRPRLLERQSHHQTRGPGLRGFRLNVRVAVQHRRIRAGGRLRAWTGRLVGNRAAVVEVPLTG